MSILKDLDPEYARLLNDQAQKKREGMGLVMPTVLLSLSTLLLLAALIYGQELLTTPEAPAILPSVPAPIPISKTKTPQVTSTAQVAPPEVLPDESGKELTKAQSNPLLVLEEPPSAGPLKAKIAKRQSKPEKTKMARKVAAKKIALNKSAKRQQKTPEDPPLRRDIDIITAIMR